MFAPASTMFIPGRSQAVSSSSEYDSNAALVEATQDPVVLQRRLKPQTVVLHNERLAQQRAAGYSSSDRDSLPEPDPLQGLCEPRQGAQRVTGSIRGGRVAADMDDRVVVLIWAEGEKGEIPELYERIVGLGRCALELLVQVFHD